MEWSGQTIKLYYLLMKLKACRFYGILQIHIIKFVEKRMRRGKKIANWNTSVTCCEAQNMSFCRPSNAGQNRGEKKDEPEEPFVVAKYKSVVRLKCGGAL